MKITGFISITLLLLFFSCNSNHKKLEAQQNNLDTAILVGSDRDTHGCIGSAGYQWSELKQECIRIFEAGTAFKAYGENTDSTLAAYVVYASNMEKVEVFLPQLPEPIMLTKVEQVEGDIAPILFQNLDQNISIIKVKDVEYIKLNGNLIFSK